MNNYYQLKEQHSKRINDFPMMFAFSNEQFNEGMKKLGLEPHETGKIYSIGAGGYIRKTDSKLLDELFAKNENEMKEAIVSDPTGENFIYEMFLYELNNHEYGYTYELGDTLNALSLTYDEVVNDIKLKTGLEKAKKKIQDSDRW